VVVAYSGFARLEEMALTHGAAAFLKKPVDLRQLVEALATQLEHRPLSASAIAAHEEFYRNAIAAADRRRESILHRAPLDTPAFRVQLRQLVAWLTGYFSTEVSVIGLVHCGRIFVLARAGTEEFDEDACLDLNASYCPDVARAAAPLIIRE